MKAACENGGSPRTIGMEWAAAPRGGTGIGIVRARGGKDCAADRGRSQQDRAVLHNVKNLLDETTTKVQEND